MSKFKSIDKEALLFCYNKAPFPTNLISNETLIHSDLLFTQNEQEPELYNKKKQK